MAGNSQRRGAIRKSSKGPSAGSGGQVRRGLEGKGPTPKAKERPYHKAHKDAQRAERAGQGRPNRRATTGEAEWIVGRNSVLEALRAHIPVTALYVAEGAERDGRLREIFKLAAESSINLLEVTRNELDRNTGGVVNQGVAARLPAFEYAHADDLVDQATAMGDIPLIVVLDSITDPRNLGAVVRSAAGFGAHGEPRASSRRDDGVRVEDQRGCRRQVAHRPDGQPDPPAQRVQGRGVHGGGTGRGR